MAEAGAEEAETEPERLGDEEILDDDEGGVHEDELLERGAEEEEEGVGQKESKRGLSLCAGL